MQPESNPSLDPLIDTARRAVRAGRLDEAARAWEQVRVLAPDHAEALFFFGQRALAQRDLAAAVQWLQRASRSAPRDAVIPLSLANAHRALGDPVGEMAALTAALTADPYCYPALLAQAALLEKTGRRRQAARIFADALKIAPAEERLPPDLRNLVRRARDAVHENTNALEAFLDVKLGKARDAHAGARLDRFEECKDAMTGRKRIYTQQPVMLNFPRLPAIQFYDDEQFPWLKELEAGTDAIESELSVLLRDRQGFRPYMNHPDGVPLNDSAVLNRSADWSAYFFWDDGKRIDEHCARCPKTTAILETMPLADVPGFTPAAFFSTLNPGARIPPHTGVTNTRLIVHLGITVPQRCSFRVGNETREWRRGKAWVFDDTIEHEARNESDELRVILIFDIWNPYLSLAERELVCELLAAQREYYGGEGASH
ncbi:MAG: aspartyl/asparaginyl beta-hydroxylase domain-containing protein [Alphaproteobacteria bacterium]|nr:aspartyl/asparaginyl beta-hydroxylase domain-containing protein [Alphaproteobacteria bacterium]